MYVNPYYEPYWLQHDDDSESLEHYGVIGMKWGIRRFQDKDGKLTDAGKVRYTKVLDPSAGVVPNKNLKLAYSVYEADVQKRAKLITKAYDIAVGTAEEHGYDPLKFAGDATGVYLSKIPESINDMQPIFRVAEDRAFKALYGNMDEDKQLIFLAYKALVDAGIEDYFDVGIQTENGKKVLFYRHVRTGDISKTIGDAKMYMKTLGVKQREKNVQGDPVTIKVNKNKSVSSTPVATDVNKKYYDDIARIYKTRKTTTSITAR